MRIFHKIPVCRKHFAISALVLSVLSANVLSEGATASEFLVERKSAPSARYIDSFGKAVDYSLEPFVHAVPQAETPELVAGASGGARTGVLNFAPQWHSNFLPVDMNRVLFGQIITRRWQHDYAAAWSLPCDLQTKTRKLSIQQEWHIDIDPEIAENKPLTKWTESLKQGNAAVIAYTRSRPGITSTFENIENIWNTNPAFNNGFQFKPYAQYDWSAVKQIQKAWEVHIPNNTSLYARNIAQMPDPQWKRLFDKNNLFGKTEIVKGVKTNWNFKSLKNHYNNTYGVDEKFFEDQYDNIIRDFGTNVPITSRPFLPFGDRLLEHQSCEKSCPGCACGGSPAPAIPPVSCVGPGLAGGGVGGGGSAKEETTAQKNWGKCKKANDELAAKGINKVRNCSLILEPNSAPNAVAIIDRNSKVTFCTGTLIDEENLLTAAHCLCGSEKADSAFFGEKAWNTPNAVRTSVDLSSWRKKKNSDFCTQYREWQADKSRPYPEDDIAILRLAKSISSENIRNSVLPVPQFWNGEAYVRAYVAGFGASDESDQTGVKNIVNLKIEKDGCVTDGDGKRRCTAGKSFIAVAPKDNKGADSCFGDSGGPLMVVDEHGIHYLAGLVIKGTKENEKNKCGKGGIYADLRDKSIREWIVSSTKKEIVSLVEKE